MTREILIDILLGIGFVLAEVLIFQHLPVFNATPDPLLVYLIWLALKYDRIKLVFFAALLGFLQDALFETWGLNMFSKTLLCFWAFNFLKRNSERQLITWQIFLIVYIAAIFHNLIFLGLSSFIEAYASGYFPVIFVLLNSLYTALIGTMIYIFKGG